MRLIEEITVNTMLILGDDRWTDAIKPHLKPDREIKEGGFAFGSPFKCLVNKLRHILRAPVPDKHHAKCWYIHIVIL